MRRISFRHIDFLTDDFGIWQHTDKGEINRKFGYALDDAARALLVAVQYKDQKKQKIYYSYLAKALGGSKTINFFGPDRKLLSGNWSEDALGEAYWAIAHYSDLDNIIGKIKKKIGKFQSLRGQAYALLGAAKNDPILADKLAGRISDQFPNGDSSSWRWPEDTLRYANAIIPYSLLSFAEVSEKGSHYNKALSMLNFLNKETKANGKPIAIGNDGWYARGGEKALFDQQPVDPAYQVLANVKAWELSGEKKYLDEAKIYFSWFWGNNVLGKPLIDFSDGSCHDAICSRGVSGNRGAESIICYLLAQNAIWKYL